MRTAWTAAAAALAMCGLSACAAQVVIKPDDPVFAHAQQNLRRSADEVAALPATAAERALFMQAEGFYRYRFQSGPRSAATYATEAAAALTDFPAFQSLAGSLDIADQRYRSADSAIQLWETLLEDYPDTSLKPLTLYRLGWAYRSSGLIGLPRQSPDAAFDELIAEYPDSSLSALAREAKAVPWKSKRTATERSVIPGLGQLYVGDRNSGWWHLGVAVAAVAAVVVPVVIASQRGHDLNWRHDWPLLALGGTGLVVLSFDYTDSYQQAVHGAVEWNERQEARFEHTHPESP